MLKRTQNFLRTTLIGGVIVILPAIILIFAFKWLFGVVANAIQPLTDLAVKNIPLPARFDEAIATVIVLIVIILVCFFFGLFVRTRLGQIIYHGFENSVLSRAPGYRMIKETVNHFIGRKESPFASVALVQIFENDTKVTAFITDRHEDGTVTVFVPTGPNPTTGFIYHLNKRFVHPVNISVEEAMRSVISCGAGSGSLIRGLKSDTDQPKIST
ncbi:MAG: DUF502 domain-containing protein [Pontiella sp.]|nr:DUF502 domain-containing protein [Pontiella sp.]